MYYLLHTLQFNLINKTLIFLSFLFITLLIFINLNSCFKVPPYGYINGYSSLVFSSEFCVGNKKKIYFSTNSFGARILQNNQSKSRIKVFGDSQVLGLDVSKKSDHYLGNIYHDTSLFIYAAPNNGPYEVLNSLELNVLRNEKIVIAFNASTDFFRLEDDWSFYDHVSLSIDQANLFSKIPFLYDFYNLIIFYSKKEKELLNNKQMQNLFMQYPNQFFENQFNKYFQSLNDLVLDKNIYLDYFITHPYWIYDVRENELNLNQTVYNKYKDLINKIHNKYPNIKFSKVYNNKMNDVELTSDKRHLKSNNFLF